MQDLAIVIPNRYLIKVEDFFTTTTFLKNVANLPEYLLLIVVPAGFEPTYSESKSDVLPLDEGTIGSRYGNRTRVPRMKIWCPDP